MYIYNITTNIEGSHEQKWLDWMQNTHIPEMLATGKFTSAKLCKVLIEEEMGGVTYSVQYGVESLEILKEFHNTEAPILKNKANSLFAGHFVYFETELQLMDKQFSAVN
jgi:hypothetical protein